MELFWCFAWNIRFKIIKPIYEESLDFTGYNDMYPVEISLCILNSKTW